MFITEYQTYWFIKYTRVGYCTQKHDSHERVWSKPVICLLTMDQVTHSLSHTLPLVIQLLQRQQLQHIVTD